MLHRTLAVARLVALLLAAAVTLSPARPGSAPGAAGAAAPSQWAMYGHDAAHTGFNPDETVLRPPLIQKWRVTWPRAVFGGAYPVIANGAVYVIGGDGLSSLDSQTGAIRWTAPGFQNENLVVDNGIVYATAVSASALDAQTGALLWSTRVCPVTVLGARPTVSGGVLYLGGSTSGPPRVNKLCALDAQTGALRWSFVTSSEIFSTPAVAGGLVYFAGEDAILYALDVQTGVLRWSFPGGGDSNTNSPAVAGGVVYFLSSGGTFYALDAQTGAIVWTAAATVCGCYETPAVAQGVVYYSDGNGTHARDAQTGALKWTAQGASAGAPAIANGVVYLDSVALDAETGAVRWDLKPDNGPRLGKSVVAEGNLFMSGGYYGVIGADLTVVAAFQNVKDTLFLPLVVQGTASW